MKIKSFYLGILVTGFMLVNFGVNQAYGQSPKNKTAQQQTVKYTCSMHPEVLQDKPGNCPKCGMKLIEKKEVKKQGMKKDSTMMKHDHTKMVQDSSKMKKNSSAAKKHDHMNMQH